MLYRDIEFRLAANRLDLEKSYKLVCDIYKRKRYLDNNWPWDIWVMPYCMHPETVVALAILDGDVIGTSSLFFPRGIGLPVQKTFKETRDFEHPMEIGKLAIDEDKVKNLFSSISSIGVVLGIWAVLYKVALRKSIEMDVDFDLLIEVLPFHTAFYERIGFRIISSPQTYAMMDKTVYCMYQSFYNFKEFISQHPLLRRLFPSQDKETPGTMYKLSWDDVEYFLKEKTDMWYRMDEHCRDFLLDVYK